MTTEEMQKQIESVTPTPDQIIKSIDKKLEEKREQIVQVMDYEKKYKDAMGMAEEIIRYYKEHNRDDETSIEDLEQIFPELKNEDEKIRNALIALLKFGLEDGSAIAPGFNETKEQALAWLEKQGEQKPVLDFKASNWYVSKVDGKIHDMTYNSANKVELKFKVGDYIVNDYCMGRVVEITDDAYLLDIGQGIPFSCEHNVHLWTIKDAKDGDVLARNNDILSICIFSHFDGINNKFSSFLCHCGLEGEGLGQELSMNGYHDDSKNYVPATKEQRNLLFTMIKEVGYRWDAEKKELKKIEQKSTWSSEDKSALEDIEEAITNYWHGDTQDILLDWLKRLKDRIGG